LSNRAERRAAQARWQDSISERPVYLNLNRRQFKCAPCGKPFSEEFEFIGKRRLYTDRFAEMIVQQVKHSDQHNVGVNHGLSDEEVASTVQYCAKKITKLLKSSKYALLNPEANLTDKQKVKLEQVNQLSPLLTTLHQKKEDLR
jgi:transposase